jgi:hypothetical protein
MSDTALPRRRYRIWPIVVGIIVFGLLLLFWLWNWDWFIPLVDARASGVLGRQVTMQHLHVHLGRQTTVVADNVTVANPSGFPEGTPLATAAHLRVTANVMDYIHHRTIVLPLIGLDQPRIAATVLRDGQNNFTFKFANGNASGGKPAPPPQIGELRITDGLARFVDPKLRSDFTLGIATREATATTPAAIVMKADGTYAAQKVIGSFVGGALLTLRDTSHPYPIDVRLENGATRLSLQGTVLNPMNFAGARVQLRVAGPDMAALFPLTGIPFPSTPPFSLAGAVDYAKPRIRVSDIFGRVGSSDLEGTIAEDPGAGGKPDVVMDLSSKRIDLTDLGGFVGTPAGKPSTPGETASQKRVLEHAAEKKTLLPDTPINVPKLEAANIHLKYRGEHIENKFTPFDKLLVTLDVMDGRITLHPLDFEVGNGQIASNIDLTPLSDRNVRARANIAFQHIDISRLMQATHTFHGRGIIGGEAKIDTTGNSLANMMGHGNGEVKLALTSAGNLSALLVDLTGLEFGNALLSAMGVPRRADIKCFVTDLPLRDGKLDAKVFLVDTTEGRITGKGDVDFTDQTLNFSVTTRSKGFSIGSLPGPIDITGPLNKPSIRPGAEIVARAGAAVGLGVLLTPLGALLPTIQFGVGKDNACTAAIAEERKPLHVPVARHVGRHAHREG